MWQKIDAWKVWPGCESVVWTKQKRSFCQRSNLSQTRSKSSWTVKSGVVQTFFWFPSGRSIVRIDGKGLIDVSGI